MPRITRTILLVILSIFLALIFFYSIFHRTIYVGVWTHGLWNTKTKIIHPEALKTFESMAGKKMAIAHIYVGWGELDDKAVIQALNTLDQNGWIPMLSVNPYFFDGCRPYGQSLYRTIAEGSCDQFLHTIAQRFKEFHKPILLRFAWEMNIKSNEWSVPYTRSSATDFILAWKHVHSIFSEYNGENIKWVFCPNVRNGNTIDFEDLYPGDQYVDWTCLDGYNWGTSQTWSSWQSFNNIFYESYQRITALAPDKPVMIGEVNSSVHGGDKSAWVRDMLVIQIPLRFQKVKALVFYNEDRTEQEVVDWRLEKDPSSLATFKFWIQLPLYSVINSTI